MDTTILARHLPRHLPLITPRIKFLPAVLDSLPTITPRINFATRLAQDSDCTLLGLEGDSNWQSGRHKHQPTLTSSDQLELLDALDNFDESVTDIEVILSNNKKIPKPPGQPGRPHSGGYNLETMIKAWGGKLIDEVKVSTTDLSVIHAITIYYPLQDICKTSRRQRTRHHKVISAPRIIVVEKGLPSGEKYIFILTNGLSESLP
jgi:hypothetical protein